ncbi:hypothetical protein X975_01161, partial [Stegodyphus mimosarum]
MADSSSITCPSCRISIVPSRARTMCPFCGSFYNRAANNDVSLRRRSADDPVRLPQLVENVNGTAASRSQPEFYLRGSIRTSNQDTGSRQIVQVTGFGPFITDTLGVIHTYITGLLLPPSSPDATPVYVTLPPISQGGEGQLVTLRNETRQQAYVPSDGRTSLLAGSAASSATKPTLIDDLQPNLILYPTKDMTVRQLKEDLDEAKVTGDYTRLQEYY